MEIPSTEIPGTENEKILALKRISGAKSYQKRMSEACDPIASPSKLKIAMEQEILEINRGTMTWKQNSDICTKIMEHPNADEGVLLSALMHPSIAIRGAAILHKRATEQVMRAAMGNHTDHCVVARNPNASEDIIIESMMNESLPIAFNACFNEATTPQIFIKALKISRGLIKKRLIKILRERDPLFQLAVKAHMRS